MPQGSILGPLLFLVYIIDLPPSVIKSIPLLFADDTKCLKQVCSPQDSSDLQLDLDGINKWSMQWKLAFNEKQSAHISFSCNSNQSHSNYSFKNQPILLQESHIDLGVIVSSDLSWSNHHAHICKQACSILSFLCRSISSTSNKAFSCALKNNLLFTSLAPTPERGDFTIYYQYLNTYL